jgi:hypothetical protein
MKIYRVCVCVCVCVHSPVYAILSKKFIMGKTHVVSALIQPLSSQLSWQVLWPHRFTSALIKMHSLPK